MTEQALKGERERLNELREEVANCILAAEIAFGSEATFVPAIEWLEELTNQLSELEDLLDSENGDELLENEESEELRLWAEGFSNCINDGEDIEEECCDEVQPQTAADALVRLLSGHITPIRDACWALYNASIGAA